MIDLKNLTIKKAHQALLDKEYSCVDLAKAYLENIKIRNESVNAYLEIYDDVLAQAQKADEIFKEGKATLLTGIPVAIKDNILVKDRIVSSASKMLENYRGTYDATVIVKLKKQGAVLLGRTNMDEFAMGGSTENSAYGVTRNPLDESRVPGGSSGGSAASVAMDGALIALGSDTGGSIRQPASFCGVVGLKPSYGTISRYGLMAMASSLDQIGPITKNVEDAEIVFDSLKGKDPMDSTSLDISHVNTKADTDSKKIDVEKNQNIEVKKLKIGVPFSFLAQGLEKEVKENFDQTLETLKKQGHTIVDISLPNIASALAVYYILMPAEVSSNLARFDGVKYGLHVDGRDLLADYLETRKAGFGAEVKRRIILGTYVLSTGYYDAYYNKANTVRALLINDFEKAFETVDVILTPTSPVLPFKIGEKTADPLSMYLADIFTVSANITSLPALSLPSGSIEKEGKQLPFGIQFTAPFLREDLLFTIGKLFEQTQV